jgi:hypothetical protein
MDGTQAEVPKPDTQPAAAEVTPTPKVEIPPAAKTYTEAQHQAGINSAVQKRLARERQPEPPREEAPKPAPDPSPKPSTKADLSLEVESLRGDLQFERAVRGLDIDDDRRDVLETLFKAEKPQHLREWAKEKMKVMGWAKSDTSPAQSVSKTEAAPTSDPTPPAGPPASDNGAPSPQPTFEQTGNPELLTKDSIARIYSEKGVRNGMIHIKDMAERWYKGKRVTVD